MAIYRTDAIHLLLESSLPPRWVAFSRVVELRQSTIVGTVVKMDEETRNHKERLLAIYLDNLRELEVQAARHGVNPPLILVNEIKHHRQNIFDIQKQLNENADEQSFDKILYGIEDLRRFSKEEAIRVLKEYNDVHRGEPMLGQGLVGVFASGVCLAFGLDYLYLTFIKHQSMESTRDAVSILIYGL